MKLQISLFAVLLLTASTLTGRSQITAPTQFAGARIAFVNTDSFSDEKNGITRLVNAYKKLELDFKPEQDKILELNGKIEAVARDAEDIRSKLSRPGVPVDSKMLEASLAAKLEESARLQKDFTRMQEDAKQAFEKQQKIRIQPIMTDIGNALDAYAKAHNIDVVIDASKLADMGALLTLSNGVDISAAFIKEYNARSATSPAK